MLHYFSPIYRFDYVMRSSLTSHFKHTLKSTWIHTAFTEICFRNFGSIKISWDFMAFHSRTHRTRKVHWNQLKDKFFLQILWILFDDWLIDTNLSIHAIYIECFVLHSFPNWFWYRINDNTFMKTLTFILLLFLNTCLCQKRQLTRYQDCTETSMRVWFWMSRSVMFWWI